MTEGTRKATVAASFADSGIAIANFVGFLPTRPAGMPAEPVHSVADTGDQGPAARQVTIDPDLHPAGEHP